MSSVLIPHSLSFFFNSNPATGSVNRSADGSAFSVILNTPLLIPTSAVSCDINIQSATVPYVSPNISAEEKNNIFTFTTSVAPAGTYSITIPDGLYSIDTLGQTLANGLANLGFPLNLFTITGDISTSKTVITFLTSGDSIDFTTPINLRIILGFDALVYTAPSAGYNQYSPNGAIFNSDTSYLILSDLLSSGIPVNNRQAGILTNIPITAQPGSAIVYEPSNPITVDAGELIGNPRINMRFTLTNQELDPVETLGNEYSFVLIITYYTLLTSERVPIMPR